MTSLYRRATPSQARILRAVEGAVRNAAHAHPDRPLDKHMARSIAKRAAGTLSAQWAGVLAAKPSDSAGGHSPGPGPRPPRPLRIVSGLGKGERRTLLRRSPLSFLQHRIGFLAGQARRSGLPDREAALVEVLRLIASMKLC